MILSEDGTTSPLQVLDGTVELTALAEGAVQTVNAGEAISSTTTDEPSSSTTTVLLLAVAGVLVVAATRGRLIPAPPHPARRTVASSRPHGRSRAGSVTRPDRPSIDRARAVTRCSPERSCGIILSRDMLKVLRGAPGPRSGALSVITMVQDERPRRYEMLLRSDPFRELDRLSEQVFGTRTRPAVMPMDAYREGDRVVVHFDLPGVDPSSIDLTVEKNVLAVSAERRWEPREDQQVVVSERPQGTFRRQLFLGENLDLEHVQANYEHGVLTVTIPLAEKAKPRKVEITTGSGAAAIEATSTDS